MSHLTSRLSRRSLLAVGLTPLAAASAASAAGAQETPRERERRGDGTPNAIPITVAETAGIRRFGYPISVDVPLPRGAAREAGQVALEGEEGAVRGTQYDIRSRWPDGSIQWLAVSTNLSQGPLERRALRLRFGADVGRQEGVGRPSVEETEAAFVVRNTYRVPRAGAGFLEAIRYGGREFLRQPAAWAVKNAYGAVEPVLETRVSRALSTGATNAVIELEGELKGLRLKLPYRLSLSFPNSKSWFDAVLEIDDPEREITELQVTLPYVMERLPTLFDLGVGSWQYGTLKEGEAAVLEQPAGQPWKLFTGPAEGQRSLYAAESRLQPAMEGWGHLTENGQGGRCVAFGTPGWVRDDGAAFRSIRMTAAGEVTFLWRFQRQRRIRVQVLAHHISDPVHVTAVTSPQSMLHPLRATLPDDWYSRAGAGRVRPGLR